MSETKGSLDTCSRPSWSGTSFILSIEVLNPAIPAELKEDKDVEFDIRALLGTQERVDVEMQINNRPSASVPSRLVFYGARDFSGQLRAGEDYNRLTPTVVVAWLTRRLFSDLEAFHSIFELRERSTHRLYTDDLSLHILQLSEINTVSTAPESDYSKRTRLWARFLCAQSESEFKTLAKETPTMASAVDALHDLSQDPEARRLAQERMDAAKLRQIEIAEGEARGEARGKAQGLRDSILRLCSELDIEVTPSRQVELEASDDLSAILTELAVHHRWPD